MDYFPKWLDLDRQPYDPCRVPPFRLRSDSAAIHINPEKLNARYLYCRSDSPQSIAAESTMKAS